MNLSKELLSKARAAGSCDELLALAQENGLKLSTEDAGKYYQRLRGAETLADEELDNVSGGCDPNPEEVRSTDLKCDHYGCRCSVYGRAFIDYYPPEYTCPCSECGQGTLHVTGWTTRNGDHYDND